MSHRSGPAISALVRVVLLKSLFVSLGLLTSTLLAQLLGRADYGRYAYTIACISLIAIPASLGLDRLLVRDISIYASKAQWPYLFGLLRWSRVIVLLTSVGFMSLGNTFIWSTDFIESPLKLPLSIGLLYIPLGALKELNLATMRGLNHVALSLLPDTILAPLLLIATISLCRWLGSENLSLLSVLAIQLGVLGTTLAISLVVLQRLLPTLAKKTTLAYQGRKWILSALPMMVLGALQIIHGRIDVLMLGNLHGPETVAIYSAVLQGMNYITIPLLSTNTLLAAQIAKLYAAGELVQLEQMLIQSARIVVGLSSLAMVVMISFSQTYFNLFGDSYSSGRLTLVLLCVGQLVNVTTGSVGVVLNMTGHEYSMMLSVGLSVLLNIGLNLFLIPLWGANGAAVATIVSLTFVNVVKALWVYRHLGLNVTCFGEIK